MVQPLGLFGLCVIGSGYGFGLKVNVEPEQTKYERINVCALFTVSGPDVREQPVIDEVYVKVTAPTFKAVTIPSFVIEATNVLLLIHTPEESGDKLVVSPTHIF